jgi:LAS superfamily LD-carboxypeptidase LdcB
MYLSSFQRYPVFIFCVISMVSLAMCQNAPVESEAAVTEPEVDTMQVPVPEDTIEAFTLGYLTGHFNPAEHPDFVLIDTMHADRAGLYLHKRTYAAFVDMYEAAMQDGIQLQIRSATRNFNTQKYIWERKWTGETTIENGKNASTAYPDPGTRATMILKYSSMPGTSRHHWGTDIDLNSFENSWFESGPGLDIYNWLTEHAASFGFCQPYSQKSPERPHGYEEERWHWSYMPLSQPLTKIAADSLKAEMISGFLGSDVAVKLNVVERYVLGISADCM